MQILILYLASALTFLVVDAIMLRSVMKPLFEANIGAMMRDDLNLGAAAIFYLFYVAGAVWLVAWPALQAESAGRVLLNGAILGAVAYGTYEFTSFAIMKNWTWQMVLTDTTWGAVLTAGSLWVGYTAARAWG